MYATNDCCCNCIVDKLYAVRRIHYMSNVKNSIDVRRFLQFFGGPSAMRELWGEGGFHLTKGAQDKWMMRGTIPTARLLEAVQIAKRKRKKLDLNAFLKTGSK